MALYTREHRQVLVENKWIGWIAGLPKKQVNERKEATSTGGAAGVVSPSLSQCTTRLLGGVAEATTHLLVSTYHYDLWMGFPRTTMICGCDFHFQAAYLEPENRAVQGAVPEEAEPAGVRGHIAADLASALGAEVKRHGKPMLGEEGVQGLQDAARLLCVTKLTGR